MNDIDTRAQQILDSSIALKESCASHNLRSALAESQFRCTCWRVAAWVFGICFLIHIAVNVWKM